MTEKPWRVSLIVLAAMAAVVVLLVYALTSTVELAENPGERTHALEIEARADERLARFADGGTLTTGTATAAFCIASALALLFGWLACRRESEHRTSRTQITRDGSFGASQAATDNSFRPILTSGTSHAPDDRSAAARMQLERKIKTDFIATISHEIRTPINAVIGMADLLKLTDLTRKQQSYVQHIQSSGDMLLNLVDNILDFAKLEAGIFAIRTEEFSLTCLVERVLEIMGHQAYSKGLELTVTPRSNPSRRILADKHRLCQVLINLVANSVKYTDRGTIDIAVELESQSSRPPMLRLVVSDTGHGFDSSLKDMMFTPFVSGQRRNAQRHEGSGLGLPICKRLVDSMGGSIAIESSIGIGTRVTINVPVGERPVHSNETQLPCNDGAAPCRILIAHSNGAAGLSIAVLLELWGAECQLALTRTAALAYLRGSISKGRPFDRAVLDTDLTRTDPLMLAREIRSEVPADRLPIVLLNPIAKPLEVGIVSRIRGVRCIDKPVLPTMLRDNLLQTPVGEPEAASGTVRPRRDRSLRILVAEDNVVNGQLLLSMLRAEGHEAEGASDPRAIFSAMERNAYDIVLMDGRMPGMDGDRIAGLIRANPTRFASQPVIVAVTAEATEQFRAQCLAAGMNDFITKPIRLDELRACINRWTGAPRIPPNGESTDTKGSRSAFAVRLVERVGKQDMRLVQRYIDLFLFDTQERLGKIARAIDKKDSSAIRQECHAVKGACLEFGAERMVRCCENLAAAASENSDTALNSARQALEEEFVRLQPLIESATATLH